MLSANALRLAIERHNRSRGVEKTSIHLFRHTFARKYLIDCGGDAFMLQKLLGHSTLKMTRHYCNIYDADLAKNYDRLSPLAIMSQPNKKIMLSSDGFQDFVVCMPEGIRVEHGARLGRREHIRIPWMFLVFLHQ